MIRGISTVALLICSNLFMTLAWYGPSIFGGSNNKIAEKLSTLGLPMMVLVCWGVALLEYCFMVPANHIGFKENGGPFSIWELKVIQEAVSLTVFAVVVQLFMQNESIRWNHLAGFACLVLAVFFIFFFKK